MIKWLFVKIVNLLHVGQLFYADHSRVGYDSGEVGACRRPSGLPDVANHPVDSATVSVKDVNDSTFGSAVDLAGGIEGVGVGGERDGSGESFVSFLADHGEIVPDIDDTMARLSAGHVYVA